jgi:ATP-dependent Clp protease ATP-binding subunit ClpA
VFERFTDRARKIMKLANDVAGRFNHPRIESEHVLWGLLKEGSGVGASSLRSLGVNLNALAAEIYNGFVPSIGVIVPSGTAAQCPDTRKVIEAAISEARRLNHNYVGSEHILLGILATPESSARKILQANGIELERTRQCVIGLVGSAPEESKTSVHDSFKELLLGIDEELLSLNMRKEEAVKAADYERAAELRDRSDAAKDELERIAQQLSLLLDNLKRARGEKPQ